MSRIQLKRHLVAPACVSIHDALRQCVPSASIFAMTCVMYLCPLILLSFTGVIAGSAANIPAVAIHAAASAAHGLACPSPLTPFVSLRETAIPCLLGHDLAFTSWRGHVTHVPSSSGAPPIPAGPMIGLLRSTLRPTSKDAQ